LGIIWLALAFLAWTFPGARRWFGYLGAIVALVHACALVIGLIVARFVGPQTVNGGVNGAGFLGGIVLGLALGIWLGWLVGKNQALYWPVQLAAAAFLIFLPLFRLR
jgi:fructose-specific phosphotransferase system IIC component